jgi:hypothetical protein
MTIGSPSAGRIRSEERLIADKLSAGHEPQQVSDADMTPAKAIISAPLSGRSSRAGSISSDHM